MILYVQHAFAINSSCEWDVFRPATKSRHGTGFHISNFKYLTKKSPRSLQGSVVKVFFKDLAAVLLNIGCFTLTFFFINEFEEDRPNDEEEYH